MIALAKGTFIFNNNYVISYTIKYIKLVWYNLRAFLTTLHFSVASRLFCITLFPQGVVATFDQTHRCSYIIMFVTCCQQSLRSVSAERTTAPPLPPSVRSSRTVTQTAPATAQRTYSQRKEAVIVHHQQAHPQQTIRNHRKPFYRLGGSKSRTQKVTQK